MLRISEVKSFIIDDIAENMELDSCNEEHRRKIQMLSVRDAFDKYLTWQGIIGYTDTLIKVYENLKQAEIKPK